MPWITIGKEHLDIVGINEQRGLIPAKLGYEEIWVSELGPSTDYDRLLPYPAIQSRAEIRLMRSLARRIPANGRIVECGCYLAGNLKVIAEAVDPSVTIHGIDDSYSEHDCMWLMPEHVIDWRKSWDLDQHWHKGMLGWAQWYLREHSNIQLHGWSVPYKCTPWQDPIDLFFEDTSHANPQLRDTLDFWVLFVKSGGIIAGHDYHNPAYPDVKTETALLAQRLGTELVISDAKTISNEKICGIWWMIKP